MAELGFVFAFRHRSEPTEQEQSEHEADHETDYETGYEVHHRTCAVVRQLLRYLQRF